VNLPLRRLPPLTALRAFHAAGRHLSMKAAAEELLLTPSAVSHQVRALERQLGLDLFVRGHRSLSLTAEGRDYWELLDRAFAEIARGTERLTAGRRPRLRISALPMIADALLLPRLGALQAALPDVEIALDTANRLADFARDPVDVAIRFGRGGWPGLASEVLLPLTFTAVCAPAVAARLSGVADLAGEVLIQHSAKPDGWREWLAAAGHPGLAPRAELAVDSLQAALSAAAQGLGVAYAPLELADLRGLALPFPGLRVAGYAYHLVCRPEDRGRPDVAALRDWLRDAVAALPRVA